MDWRLRVSNCIRATAKGIEGTEREEANEMNLQKRGTHQKTTGTVCHLKRQRFAQRSAIKLK